MAIICKGGKVMMNNTVQKKEYILEGLDCANCAAKIERSVKKIDDVNECSVNFATKTLMIETDAKKMVTVSEEAVRVVKQTEPEVVIIEKKRAQIEYELQGLDCANCAAKIEEEVRALSGVSDVQLSFVTRKLSFHLDSQMKPLEIENHIKKIVNRLEPDVTVVKMNSSVKKSSEGTQFEAIKPTVMRLIVGGVLTLIAALTSFSTTIEFALFFIAYLIVGGDVLLKAAKNIIRGKVFDENFLMAIATIGAFLIGEFPEGVSVMLFYQIGELFQKVAVNKSRKSIADLMDIRPDYANVFRDGEYKTVSPEEVIIGETIIVKPGEKVPLDGIIITGTSSMDTSALTGESVPREVTEGSEVLSGFINKNGVITLQVQKGFEESTVSKILELVQNASNRKAPTENFITKFARYYTPFVVITAALLAFVPPLIISGELFSDWIYRALVFLVISCPCALVVSIPLGFFGGIGAASRKGILIKGSNYLEALNDVKYVVFDKTGTLTKGVFEVTNVQAVDGYTREQVIEYAAYAEAYSNHPIAVSIRNAFGAELNKDQINDYEEVTGHGTVVKWKDDEILAGNKKLMKEKNIAYTAVDSIGTIVYVAVNNMFIGSIVISDEIKEDAKKAITMLKELGVKKTIMLTGDAKSVGDKVAATLGLDDVHAELLPHQKVEQFEKIEQEKHAKEKIVFVGDGINDTPVLARADIGMAMGGLGSDAAIEAADIVIMNDEPSRIATAINVAKRTRVIVWQNIIFAFVVKGFFLLLGAFGIATMWEAVFADVGVTVLAVLNSIRVLKVDKE